MKLVITIIDDQDVDKVVSALTSQHIGVTRVSSTGGILSPGSSTLLIGVDEAQVPQVMTLITDLAALRQTVVPISHTGGMSFTGLIEAQVGGFLSFVMDIQHFEQV